MQIDEASLSIRVRNERDVDEIVGWIPDAAALYLLSGSRLTWPLTASQLQGAVPERWNGVDEKAEPLTSPFHEWLVSQVNPAGERGVLGSRESLAHDYRVGLKDGDHGVARQPEELVAILRGLNADEMFLSAAREAIVDWARTSPESTGIRTESVDWSRSDHGGWGAGGGDVERYEYLCPCGDGKIVEEHDNIPGFREHDVTIMCSHCDAEWQFVEGRSVRDWRVEPILRKPQGEAA